MERPAANALVFQEPALPPLSLWDISPCQGEMSQRDSECRDHPPLHPVRIICVGADASSARGRPRVAACGCTQHSPAISLFCVGVA